MEDARGGAISRKNIVEPFLRDIVPWLSGHEVAAVADHLSADFDQRLPQTRQEPPLRRGVRMKLPRLRRNGAETNRVAAKQRHDTRVQWTRSSNSAENFVLFFPGDKLYLNVHGSSYACIAINTGLPG
jgi:hypothetical protein